VAVGYGAEVAGEKEEVEVAESWIKNPLGMGVIWEGRHLRWCVEGAYLLS
jgi:hypothetical protein